MGYSHPEQQFLNQQDFGFDQDQQQQQQGHFDPGPYRNNSTFSSFFSARSRQSLDPGYPPYTPTSAADVFGTHQPVQVQQQIQQANGLRGYNFNDAKQVNKSLFSNIDPFGTGADATSASVDSASTSGLLQPHQVNKQAHNFSNQAYLNGIHSHAQAHSQTPFGPHLAANGVGTVSVTNQQEEISTIFVVGFPDDMQEREFQNMFTFSSGFEAATLKIPNKDSTAYGSNAPSSGNANARGGAGSYQLGYPFNNDPYSLQGLDANSPWSMDPDMAPGGLNSISVQGQNSGQQNVVPPRKQIIGFAKFRSRAEALAARDLLQGRRVDIEKGAVLKAEMAKKNLHTKRGVGPLGTSATISVNSNAASSIGPAYAPLGSIGSIGGVGVNGSNMTSLGTMSSLGSISDGYSMSGLMSPGTEALERRERELGALGAMGFNMAATRRERERLDIQEREEERDRERRRQLGSMGNLGMGLGISGGMTRGPRERLVEEDERERRRKQQEQLQRERLARGSVAYDAFHNAGLAMRAQQGQNQVQDLQDSWAQASARKLSSMNLGQALGSSGLNGLRSQPISISTPGSAGPPSHVSTRPASASPSEEAAAQMATINHLHHHHHHHHLNLDHDRQDETGDSAETDTNPDFDEPIGEPFPSSFSSHGALSDIVGNAQNVSAGGLIPASTSLGSTTSSQGSRSRPYSPSPASDTSFFGPRSSILSTSILPTDATFHGQGQNVQSYQQQLYQQQQQQAQSAGPSQQPSGSRSSASGSSSGSIGDLESENVARHLSNLDLNAINTLNSMGSLSALSSYSQLGSGGAIGSINTQGGSISPQLPSPNSGAGGSTSTRGSGNASDQNPPINTLYVGNLPNSPTSSSGSQPGQLEDALRSLFSRCAGYRKLCFRQKSNGPMCFVEFDDVQYATKALNELYGHQVDGLVKGGIRLSYSKNPLGVRTPTSAGGANSSASTLQQQLQQSQQQVGGLVSPFVETSAYNNLQDVYGSALHRAPNGSVLSVDMSSLRNARREQQEITSPTYPHFATSPPPPRFISSPPVSGPGYNFGGPLSAQLPNSLSRSNSHGPSFTSTFSPFSSETPPPPRMSSQMSSENDSTIGDLRSQTQANLSNVDPTRTTG